MMVRVNLTEVLVLGHKILDFKVLWMSAVEQKIVVFVDYEKNLIVSSLRCLFLEKTEKLDECELFFSKFKLQGNVEVFPAKINEVRIPKKETPIAENSQNPENSVNQENSENSDNVEKKEDRISQI
jgi:hypothetical protein